MIKPIFYHKGRDIETLSKPKLLEVLRACMKDLLHDDCVAMGVVKYSTKGDNVQDEHTA